MARSSKSLNEVLDQLREVGLKRTQARRAILDLLVREHGPFSSEEIHAKLKSHGCDLVTVYRNVIALEKVSLIRRCDFGDRVYRYEINDSHDDHHHVVCAKCSGVTVIDYCIPKKVLDSLKKKGYQNLECRLEIFGLCPQCSRGKSLESSLSDSRKNASPNN
ncbi:transcriptional repressor [bacterium]|nr:transcriptional repressor [bacterium]